MQSLILFVMLLLFTIATTSVFVLFTATIPGPDFQLKKSIVGEAAATSATLNSTASSLRLEKDVSSSSSTHKVARLAPPFLKERSFRVIASGMTRSGSTWQYNAIRMILESDGVCGGPGNVAHSIAHPDNHEAYSHLKHVLLSSRCAVIKAHEFHAGLLPAADYVFSSHRYCVRKS